MYYTIYEKRLYFYIYILLFMSLDKLLILLKYVIMGFKVNYKTYSKPVRCRNFRTIMFRYLKLRSCVNNICQTIITNYISSMGYFIFSINGVCTRIVK